MPVSQIILKVSATNDIAQAVSLDVTSDILAAGKTIYNVGAASTTRWYFATLIDNSGNSSTFALGSYTTAAATPTSDKWEFVVSEGSKGGTIEIPEIKWSKGSLTASMFSANTAPTYNPSGFSVLFNGNNSETGGVVRWGSYSVGSKIFTMTTAVTTGALTWTLYYHRPKFRPGFRIYKNGVQVFLDSALPAAADTPSPYAFTYSIAG